MELNRHEVVLMKRSNLENIYLVIVLFLIGDIIPTSCLVQLFNQIVLLSINESLEL